MFLMLLFSLQTKSQVTIGKNIAPSKYSLLQIEVDDTKYPDGAGVHLPRLSAAEVATLTSEIDSDTEAIGLTVYNTTTKRVIFWNGTEWIPIPAILEPDFKASNGLSYSKTADYTTVELGGDLTNNTTIPLDGNVLKFEKDNAGEFAFKTPAKNNLYIKNNRIGLNTNSPEALLHINKPATGGGFRFVDGNQGTNKVLTLTDIGGGVADGTATWQDVKNYVTLSGRLINDNGTDISSETKIGPTITCSKGKWLIIGKFSAHGSDSGTTMYSWARLRNMSLTPPNNVLAVSGFPTEPGGMKVSMPLLVFYIEFPSTTNIGLYVQSPGSGSKTIVWENNMGFFYAIRLSERID